MTSPALLTKEQLAAITRRVQSSHERGDDAGPIAVDRRLLLQHIAALEQRVADLRNRLNLSEKLQGRFPVDAVQPDQKDVS